MKSTPTSFDLSPADIKNKDFKKVMLGYSPEEVVGFLDQVAKLWEKIQKRERDFLQVIEKYEAELKAWSQKESDLKLIQEQAQKEGEKIIEAAEKRTQEIRQNTENWLATVLQDVEEVERRKQNFVTAFRSALDSHYEILKKEESNQDSLAARLQHYLS